MIINKPRIKAKDTRIKEIQTEARKIFFKKGYRNATIDEIANSSGVSKGTVYLYFKNKEDLYISLMHSVNYVLTDLLKKLEEEVQNNIYKNHMKFMTAFLKVLYKTYQYDPDGLRIHQAFQHGDIFRDISTKTRENGHEIGRINFAIMRRIFQEAINLGIIRNVDTIKLSDVIWGMFTGIVNLEERKLKITKKDHIQDTLEFAFSNLAEALKPF